VRDNGDEGYTVTWYKPVEGYTACSITDFEGYTVRDNGYRGITGEG